MVKLRQNVRNCKKLKKEQKITIESQRYKREVNEKFIHVLETMDLSDGSETDTVKKMVSSIIEQLNEDTLLRK